MQALLRACLRLGQPEAALCRPHSLRLLTPDRPPGMQLPHLSGPAPGSSEEQAQLEPQETDEAEQRHCAQAPLVKHSRRAPILRSQQYQH